MFERILDLYPMNNPRFDAWERAKQVIPYLKNQGAIDLSRYGIELSGSSKKVVVEGNHRVARILQLLGNVEISNYIENHYYDNIVPNLINNALSNKLTFRVFLAECEKGLYRLKNIEY